MKMKAVVLAEMLRDVLEAKISRKDTGPNNGVSMGSSTATGFSH